MQNRINELLLSLTMPSITLTITDETAGGKLLNEIKARYEKQTSPYYAAARLWVDAIIDPADTRKLISEAFVSSFENAFA